MKNFTKEITNIKDEDSIDIDKIEELVKNFLVNIELVKNLIKIDDESRFEELEELVRDFIRKIQMIKIKDNFINKIAKMKYFNKRKLKDLIDKLETTKIKELLKHFIKGRKINQIK